LKSGSKMRAPKPGATAGNFFRGAVLAASLIALTGPSVAQTPPSPQPASSPTPQPSPSAAPSKPPEFKSPFGGNSKPGRGEEEAFSNLVSLYDKWQAAIDSLKKAQACGSKLDIERATQEANAAGQDYVFASDQYIRDYSSIVYPSRLEGDAKDRYNIDAAMVTKAVAKAGKHVSPPIQACSPRQDTTGDPPPKPEPAPPPKSGLVDDILGHVSIGVGVGIGGGRRDQNDDRRHDDRRRDDDRTQDSTDKH
jgi:hypothetical protein